MSDAGPSLYLDTSCLLKLFVPEPESIRVAELVAVESEVVVSTWAKLELTTQLQARSEGGALTRRRGMALMAKFDELMSTPPYVLVRVPTDLAEVAVDQILPFGKAAHCRTADRIHLAAMAHLGIRRLLTNDDAQARAAADLGFEVLLPRPPRRRRG